MGNSPCFSFLPPVGKPPKLTTGYWDFRGIGAPMRMMCVYAGAEVQDVKYEAKKKSKGGWSAPEWERQDKQSLKEKNPLVSLPYVINHVTGEVVAQSNAVYLYLGRIFSLSGVTQEEQLANEQILFHLHGMWMELRDLVYPFKNNQDQDAFVDSLKTFFSVTLPAYHDKLETWLRQRDWPFIAGQQPCTADFHVWEWLDQQEAMAREYDYESPLDRYPLLKAYFMRFRSLPRLRTYFEGPDSRLPINNKMAFFK